MRCGKARELIWLYVAPDESWLRPTDRQALEAHMAACEPCRQDCRESREAVGVLRACWRIGTDTAALPARVRREVRQEAHARVIRLIGASRRAVPWAVAACLVIAVLGTWAFSSREAPLLGPERPVALGGQDVPFVIALADGGRVISGSIVQTASGERKHLFLNGRHQITMNAGTRLSIEPLVKMGKRGCLVNLSLGRIYVHVAHDGNPFEVRSPHGKAVVTGTTFDVKTTEVGTILVVAEGRVRFESEAGAVQVSAGKRSTILVSSELPSPPAPCDAMTLLAWANTRGRTEVAGGIARDGPPQDDLLLSRASWGEVLVDLEDVDYASWVEQKRDWFKRQFPWVFELQEALSRQGVDVSYADLLMRSGDLWRFAYPGLGVGRRLEPDPNGLLRALSYYGQDDSWLEQQAFASLQPTGRETSATAMAAFERWAEAIETWGASCSKNGDSQVLLDSVDASLYLANTRALAIMAVQHGAEDVAAQAKDELLDLLREELRIVARCVDLSYGLGLVASAHGTCEDAGRLDALIDAIREIGAVDKEVRKYERIVGQ